jgi:hypothetical protein
MVKPIREVANVDTRRGPRWLITKGAIIVVETSLSFSMFYVGSSLPELYAEGCVDRSKENVMF